MSMMMRLVAYSLVAVHTFLVCWAVGGFIEFFSPQVFWSRFSNPEFPDWVLILHWSAILLAGVVFLYGYFTHWNKTPQYMCAAYIFLAALCTIETFGYMTSANKFILFCIEMCTYIAILVMLFKTNFFVQHFKINS